MNMQGSLIRKLMLYEFKLGYKTAEETKNVYCATGKGTVDQTTVFKWFKKFRSGCKNLDRISGKVRRDKNHRFQNGAPNPTK